MKIAHLFQAAFIRLWNKLQAHGKVILAPMLRQLETLSEREKSGNTQLAELRKEISEIKLQTYLLTMLNSQGTLDGAYFKERTQELDRKLLTAQKQLHANLDDKDSEKLDELRKLIRIFERAEHITDFDEIKFGQIVEKITVLSETEIRFNLVGGIGFTEEVVEHPEEQESPDFSDDFDSESEKSENPDEDEDLYESEDQDESEDMGMSMGM